MTRPLEGVTATAYSTNGDSGGWIEDTSMPQHCCTIVYVTDESITVYGPDPGGKTMSAAPVRKLPRGNVGMHAALQAGLIVALDLGARANRVVIEGLDIARLEFQPTAAMKRRVELKARR